MIAAEPAALDGENDMARRIPATLAITLLLAALLARPLALLSLGDTGAASLGLSLRATRSMALVIATALSAFTVAAVGIIGFIGFAAPALGRLAGVRLLPA